MSKEFAHEPDAARYVMRLNGQLVAVLDYVAHGDAVSMTRTFTNPQHRGKGFAAEVTAFAVDDVEKNTTARIVPMCWYVGDWFESNPDRAHLLTRGR